MGLDSEEGSWEILGAASTQVTQKQILGILIYGHFISKIKDQKFAVGFFFFEVYAGLKKKKGQV